MDIIKRKVITIFFIILVIVFILAIGYIVTGKIPETFEVMTNIVPLSDSGRMPDGYYRVDESNMAQLPYGNYISPLPFGGVTNIPDGYYQVTAKNASGIAIPQMGKVPYGYVATPDKTNIIAVSKSASYSDNYLSKTGGSPTGSTLLSGNAVSYGNTVSNPKTIYDSKNVDVQYRDNISDLTLQRGIYDLSFGGVMVKDLSGIMQTLPYAQGQPLPTYYRPGSFVFGSSSYVPNYEDSVYLSKTTGLSSVAVAYPSASNMGGFCNNMAKDPLSMEQKCMSISPDVCASTSCCVLLGGSKCVSGNEKGPFMHSNYSDKSIINKDVYFYKGKCYGNCQ